MRLKLVALLAVFLAMASTVSIFAVLRRPFSSPADSNFLSEYVPLSDGERALALQLALKDRGVRDALGDAQYRVTGVEDGKPTDPTFNGARGAYVHILASTNKLFSIAVDLENRKVVGVSWKDAPYTRIDPHTEGGRRAMVNIALSDSRVQALMARGNYTLVPKAQIGSYQEEHVCSEHLCWAVLIFNEDYSPPRIVGQIIVDLNTEQVVEIRVYE